jgi:hypothetical protein
MFAGLRDAYLLTGNEKAKTVLLRLSDWAVDVTQALDETQFQVMLEQEHGGMREVLADVYAMTGNKKYLDLANRFSHTKIMAPLAAGRDELNGLHANTQIPKLTGSARIYELTGDTKERDAAAFFWDCVVRHHSYAIGGDSDDEHFGPPDQLAHHLTAVTCETCNTYNMLKLTRHLLPGSRMSSTRTIMNARSTIRFWPRRSRQRECSPISSPSSPDIFALTPRRRIPSGVVSARAWKTTRNTATASISTRRRISSSTFYPFRVDVEGQARCRETRNPLSRI